MSVQSKKLKISFQKYQGTGNDFVIIDNRNGDFPKNDMELILRLCDRKIGIGSDGVILIEKDDTAEFYMDFINPDGSRSFCGNGSRCVVQYAYDNLGLEGTITFNAIDGIHEGYAEDGWIKLKMNAVSELEIGDYYLIVDTGSPHYVQYVNDVEAIDVVSAAWDVRYSERFEKDGINVNFVERQNGAIKMRTYERGVEDETLSCGTGVAAAALSAALSEDTERGEVRVITRGGDLKVSYKKEGKQFSDIWLSGPVKKVFEGTIHA